MFLYIVTFMLLLWIIFAAMIDSIMAFVGALSLLIKKDLFEHVIFILVSFSAGTLLAGAFFHLINESLEMMDKNTVFLLVFFGFCVFFLMERILHWHHCHKGKCEVHPVSWLLTFGDAVHNFLDGMIISSSFLVNISFGIVTTALIITHELPQELGDFAILVKSGLKKRKALLINFFSQITCLLGALVSYFFFVSYKEISLLVPFAAGGFIYISASDLIPELHRELDLKKSIKSFIMFVFGIVFIIMLKLVLE
ncbi:MAG: ZIP family metal transporter [Candidatus Diapherotrites archaeon]